jgi:hypothetical protein
MAPIYAPSPKPWRSGVVAVAVALAAVLVVLLWPRSHPHATPKPDPKPSPSLVASTTTVTVTGADGMICIYPTARPKVTKKHLQRGRLPASVATTGSLPSDRPPGC